MFRRLLNTSELEGNDQRFLVTEKYIQVLVNIGHEFSFIKAIILQLITKFKYMLYRSKQREENVKSQPLYHQRMYNEERRNILKYMNFAMFVPSSTDEKLLSPLEDEEKNAVIIFMESQISRKIRDPN